jgi:hypothetical protein
MRQKSKNDLIELYEYAMRDGFLYARAFPGSGYGQFISDLQKKLANGEVTLKQAFDCVINFVPKIPMDMAYDEIP